MKIPSIVWTGLCLTFSALLTTARAQPAPGRATFFTENNYRGESLVVELDTAVENLEFMRDRNNRTFNDRFRSVRIDGPVRAVVFENARFIGASTWISRDVPDLSAYSLGNNKPAFWDRAISSIQVEPAPPEDGFIRWEKRDAERVVRASYRDVFSREPDGQGVRFYVGRLIDAGWTEAQLNDALRRSDEFRNRDLKAIVERAYRTTMGRSPDASGMQTYTRNLSRGQTEAELIAELRRSHEGDDYSIGQAITRAYRDILHRDPDPEGMANYRRLVREKAYDEDRIRDSLRKSDEYKHLGHK